MRKVFIDTNIIISYLDKSRKNHNEAERLVEKLYQNSIVMVFSEDIVTNVVYNCKEREKAVEFFMFTNNDKKFKIVSFGKKILQNACEYYLKNGVFSNKADFEDILQYFSALDEGCDKIYTDDMSSFPQLDIPLFNSKDTSFYLPK